MPIFIPEPYNEYVYSKDEIDEFVSNLIRIKADKVTGAIAYHVAGLTGDEGNLLDTGYTLEDLAFGEYADGGLFDENGEIE